MKIVILGASGQIGSVLYKALKNKHDVTGTTRRSVSGLLTFDPCNDDWSVLGRPDVLINCIGQIGSSRKHSLKKVHFELTKRIIANRSIVGNPKIIQLSALGASVNHKTDFLKTKGEADDYLLQFPNTIVVRPSIVCTHRTMMVKKMLMLFKVSQWLQKMVIVPAGFPDRRFQPVMPEDLAAIVDNLCREPEPQTVINVTGPYPITFQQIIDMLFQAQKSNYRIIELSRFWTDFIVRYCLSIVFPHFINAQQYELLFEDNVAEQTEAQKYLGRPLASTEGFWMKEFTYAGH